MANITEDINRMARSDLIVALAEAREAADTRLAAVEVVQGGTQITLPEDMSYDEGITWLQRKKAEMETEVQVHHRIACHPLDGAYALSKAIAHIHGWVSLKATPGFFGSTPPAMVTMHIDAGKTVQVPWGTMCIPGIEGSICMRVDVSGGEPGINISGTVLKKDQHKVYELARLAEKYVNTESVYHGKAMAIDLAWLREERDFDPDVDGFKFLDMSGIDENSLIFDEVTTDLLNVSLFAFIRNPDACRMNNIPLKRGILLEGQYGTGKTLTAYVTAKYAVEHGFTFIMVEDARDLEQIIRMARRYEPCVVFCEDIDRVVKKERTITMDTLLNTIDGFQSKGSEIMLVLTTNHVEDIHKALMRPGRLDSVMELLPPDAAAVQRMIRYYAGPRLDPEADLEAAGKTLTGRTPAVIREVVERAKIGTISRTGSPEIEGKVNGHDLVVAAESMTRHMELMADKPSQVTQVQLFAEVLGERIGEAVGDALDGR